MTTETESLEALHLWLAERLPELQHRRHSMGCSEYGRAVKHDHAPNDLCSCWVPNVTTDALLEVLSGKWPLTLAWYPKSAVDEAHWQAIVFTVNEDGSGHDGPSGNGTTAHEALCRVAKRALEARDAG